MTERTIRIKVDASGAKREISQIDGQMRNLGGTTDRLQTQLTRVASAIATAFSVRQIVAYADEFTNIQNRIRVVVNSTAELTQKTAELLQIANATRSTYESTAVLFSRLAQSTTELGVSQERLLAITETINKSFAVSGASAQEASNAIRQLSQGFASGALRGEEFNSVAEQAPEILRAVAKETGLAYGELREFAATGGITSEILIRAIENYADTVDESFAKTNRTFEQSSAVARNNAVAFIGSSKAVQDATTSAGNALVFISENLEALGQTFVAVSVVIGGSYVANLASALAANVANTSATLNASIAARTQAQAEFFAANGVRVKTAAVQQATVAQIAYASASKAAGAALSFLAGPAGLILLAAGAFAVFASEAGRARQESAELETEIATLVDKFRQLNEEGKALTFKKLSDEQADLLRQLGEAENNIAAARQRVTDAARASGGRLTASSNQAQDEVKKAEQAASLLNKRLDEVVKTQQRLFEVGLPAADKFTDSVGETAVKLREVKGELEQLLNFQLDNLLSGSGLFGGLEGVGQDEQTAARINSRIEGLRLETQTISSELALQQAVRQGFLTQEQADLDLQTVTRIQKAITERDLLLAEKSITDEQIAAAELAFQEQLTAISAQQAEQRLQVRRAEFSQQIGLYQNYANAALALGEAFGSKSEKANKRRRRVGVIVDTAAGIGRAFAENNFYTALGISALIAANGAAQLSAINSAGGGGGGSISGATGGSVALPTQPAAAASVQTLEIVGLREEIERLEAADGFVSTQFVAKVLDKIDSANRLRGEG